MVWRYKLGGWWVREVAIDSLCLDSLLLLKIRYVGKELPTLYAATSPVPCSGCRCCSTSYSDYASSCWPSSSSGTGYRVDAAATGRLLGLRHWRHLLFSCRYLDR